MTHEEQGQAIADHLGWYYDDCSDEMIATINGHSIVWQWPSLDAMHEVIHWLAEKSAALYEDYCTELSEVFCKSSGRWPLGIYDCTDTQRAEAFLRCLNLWKE